MNEQQNYISRQISVYKTDKKLVELIDKLNPAPIETYAHIHAQGNDDGSGQRTYSTIGILVQDYSAGKGEKIKRAAGNLSPEEVKYIFTQVKNGVPVFEFQTDKIFGTPDAQGYAKVTKLRILRNTVGSDGKPRKYPWYVEIENGKGIPQKTAIGGTYCQKNSFVSEVKVFANLSDLDFFKLFSRATSYILAWEQTVAPQLISEGKAQIALHMQQNHQ